MIMVRGGGGSVARGVRGNVVDRVRCDGRRVDDDVANECAVEGFVTGYWNALLATAGPWIASIIPSGKV
jgi:hypothetical protein